MRVGRALPFSEISGYEPDEQGQVRRIGDSAWHGVHEVFQAPMLFGVTEVELDLETEAVVVNQRVVGQLQVAAEQDDMRPGARRLQGSLDDDHDVQQLVKLFMKQFCLINAGLDVFFDTGLLQVLAGNTTIVEFIVIFARWPVTAVGAFVGEIQSRIATQLGNQMQTALAHHE